MYADIFLYAYIHKIDRQIARQIDVCVYRQIDRQFRSQRCCCRFVQNPEHLVRKVQGCIHEYISMNRQRSQIYVCVFMDRQIIHYNTYRQTTRYRYVCDYRQIDVNQRCCRSFVQNPEHLIKEFRRIYQVYLKYLPVRQIVALGQSQIKSNGQNYLGPMSSPGVNPKSPFGHILDSTVRVIPWVIHNTYRQIHRHRYVCV